MTLPNSPANPAPESDAQSAHMGPPPAQVHKGTPKPPRVNPFRYVQTTLGVAALIATLFTIWTPATLFSSSLSKKLSQALEVQEQAPDAQSSSGKLTQEALPPKIGIIAGHWGNDSGAVCPDGLEEVKVNLSIATLVREKLVKMGYEVELLEELDPKLQQYKGLLLLSIHNDSCDFINDKATGYKVSPSNSTQDTEKSVYLGECMVERYGKTTGMHTHPGITNEMKYYHAFNDIDPMTPAIIIETGFMNLDRQILTTRPDLVAEGIAQGILCFLNNEPINPTPVPTP